MINSKTGCIALFAALMATSASVGVMAATPSPNGTDLRRCYLQKPSHDVRYGLRCVPYYGFVRAGDSDTAHALNAAAAKHSASATSTTVASASGTPAAATLSSTPSTRLGISELPGWASSEERPLTDETRSPDAMRAKLAVREWELHLYELGRLTKLEADTAIAPE